MPACVAPQAPSCTGKGRTIAPAARARLLAKLGRLRFEHFLGSDPLAALTPIAEATQDLGNAVVVRHRSPPATCGMTPRTS